MSKKIINDEEILRLYKEGLSYSEVKDKTGACYHRIAKIVKGIRSRKEARDIVVKKGKWKLSERGRDSLSRHAKKSCQKYGKVWTKPEQEFKNILNSIGIGVKFSNDIKKMFGVIDDENPTVYFQYPLQRYVCDFVDINNKTIYAVNGDFWHANPLLYDHNNLTKIQKHNVHHDKNRKIYLQDKGWMIVDIWESEIEWNKELVIEKIWASRKKANPSALHAEDTRIVTSDAHLDWSEKVKALWFRKPKGRPSKRQEKICIVCNKKFVANGARQIDRQKFCTLSCYKVSCRKISWPPKEELIKDIESMSFSAIGRKYGVSDNTIRKWAKFYKI